MEVTWNCVFYTFLIYLNYALSCSLKAFSTDTVLIWMPDYKAFCET